MHLRGWIAVGLVLLVAGLLAGKERVWTERSGRTMRGEFVRELNGEVTILVAGKLVTLDLDQLSDRDKQAVRDLSAGKEVLEDSPAPAAPAPASPAPAPAPAAPATDQPESKPEGVPSLTRKPIAVVMRVWTDTQGRKTTAKFVRIFGDTVVLSRPGGPVTVAFFELSEADQNYVRDLLTSRGQEAMIPTPALSAAQLDSSSTNTNTTTQDESSSGSAQPEAVAPGPDIAPAGNGAGSGGYIPERQPTSDPASEHARRIAEIRERADAQAEAARRNAEQAQSWSQGSNYSPPVIPETVFQRVPICSSCRKQVTEAEAGGSSCPHCGARWAFNSYSNPGSSRPGGMGVQALSLGGPQDERTVRGVLIMITALVVVVVLCGGVIVGALAVASASRTRGHYREAR
jgi:hypothetical protein